jgi:hypothetical protein
MSTPNQNLDEDPFGFDRNAAKDRLRNIRPSVPAPITSDMARVDAAAEAVGFVSRENSARSIPEYPQNYKVGNAPARRPTIAINMRLPDNIAAVFQRFCKENRYSYPEGLEEVLRRAGLPV